MNHSPTGCMRIIRRLCVAWLLLCTVSAFGQSAAQKSFDHLRSGFALSGSHVRARCESCHLNGVFKGTPRDCASCHQAGALLSRANVVKPARHIVTQQGCEACHNTSTFAGARFNHMAAPRGSCVGCHNGNLAEGKSTSHFATQASCDTCHRTSGWLPATRFDHAGVVAGTCTSCHNGSRASAKSATHVPVGAAQSCDSCHSTTGWVPSRWNHTQTMVAAQCASCHTGGYPPADGRPANHIPYQTVAAAAAANCDTCHKAGFASWSGARLHNTISVATGCASCHTGSYLGAVGKPATAIHATVTGNCESCHKSTANWSSAKVDHASFTAATNCASCHNGSTATGKSGTHVPVGATNCVNCHSTTGWVPSRWNHTQTVVAAQCASCHTGGYPPADGRPANHIPYQTVAAAAAANCDTCHKAGFASWSGARLHNTISVATGCANCHTGSYLGAVGKPATAIHATVTGNCESCHKSTANWSSATFAHTPANAVGTGTCDTCHNGSIAIGKPATHVPVLGGTAKCDSCHRSQASFTTSVTMNHSVVATASCKTCHSGSYTSQGALAKPGNHIPEAQLLNGAAMDCKACHTGTTSWTSVSMNHNNSQGSGAGWCKACHQSGTAFLGNMEKKSLTHKAKSGQAITDCSQSGCHRPLGTKGSAYRNWD